MTSIWKFFSLRSDSHLFFRNWPVVFIIIWMFLTKGLNRLFQSVAVVILLDICLSYFQSVKTCARWLLGPFCSWALLGGRAVESEGSFPLLMVSWCHYERDEGKELVFVAPAVITTWAHTAPFSWQWYYAYSLILALSCIPRGIMSCLLPICLGPWLD